ncbi:hypothetical protein A9267_13125 [Shewanella sp. UCD-FRSSP16_17]|nr:hypothetical protein A9267_13125 [Shewanella sp. UCD-FRSSP16_17]
MTTRFQNNEGNIKIIKKTIAYTDKHLILISHIFNKYFTKVAKSNYLGGGEQTIIGPKNQKTARFFNSIYTKY